MVSPLRRVTAIPTIWPTGRPRCDHAFDRNAGFCSVSLDRRSAVDGADGVATDVTFKSYPKLNHLLLEGEGKSLPAEYAQPGHIPDYVLDDIANFVKGVSSR